MKSIIGINWTNLLAAGLFCLSFTVLGQPAQSEQPTDTNAAPTEETSTNASENPSTITNNAPAFPSAITNVAPTGLYGGQPQPYAFETQNNTSIVAGPTSLNSTEFGSPFMGTSILGSSPGFGAPSSAPLYQAGKLVLHAQLSYSVEYATSIESQPGQRSSVVVQTLSPSFSLTLGNHWSLSYGISLPSYSSGSGLSDTVGQSVTLSGGTSYEGWNLGLSQSYSFSDTPLIQTGAQTEEESYVTGLSVSHAIAGNLSFALGLNQSIMLANQLENDYQWAGNGSFNYAFNPRLSAGLSFGETYDSISGSSSITSQSYQGVLMISPGWKTSLSLSGGAQVDEFDAAGSPELVSPVFSASLGYHMLKNTTISISAARTISPTFFSNQVSTATSVSVGLQQTLSHKFSLSVGGSYSSDSYQAIVPGPQQFVLYPVNEPPVITTTALAETRQDRVYSISAGLSYAFMPHLSTSLSYSYATDSSSLGDFGFSTSQVGLSVNYQY
ncbi:MAG TPA: hypothetical protein VH595_00705 [Verrucomicrobiae bacterium]|jgi:hypothetical protein|nr:hypothetical protein [Verrucomicrobiae bacterium]